MALPSSLRCSPRRFPPAAFGQTTGSFLPTLTPTFRSVLHASQTLEQLRQWGVGLWSYTEPWADTISPQGELLLDIYAHMGI